VYRPPDIHAGWIYSFESMIQPIESMLELANLTHNHLTIMGDINIDLLGETKPIIRG
jgi:hypothetical protein